MADFVAVLRKTLDGLGETTPDMRARVYDKARTTVAGKLAAITPPPPAAVVERQKKVLEDAIASVESEYAPAKPAFDDPLEELENVFAALKEAKPIAPAQPRPSLATPVARQPVAMPAAKPLPQPTPPVVKAEAPKTETPKPAFVPPSDRQTPPPYAAPADEEFDSFPADDRPFQDNVGYAEPAPRRRSYAGLIAAAIAVVVIGGGGYGIWLNKNEFTQMLGLNGSTPAPATPATGESTPQTPSDTATTDVASAPAADSGNQEQPAGPPKFTQRLNADGTEADAGPAGGEQTFGEGTSVAALTTPLAADQPPPLAPAAAAQDPGTAPAEATPPADAAAAPADPAAAPADAATPPAAPAQSPPAADAAQQVAVGQRAIFYEERTSAAQGSAEPGTIVWSQVQESPGGDLPPEPAIRAEATIPGKDIQLRMTIRRNGDKTLPASHIIEMIFLTPEGFGGGSIDNVLRVAMKGSEQDAGSPLLGIPAKIADGFFLIALNDSKNEIETNLNLLRRQNWIDIPIVYKSGRRALFTIEKGVPGEKVFDETIKSWQPNTAG